MMSTTEGSYLYGCANLVQYATTPSEGVIVYMAPQAYPLSPALILLLWPSQSLKIDV